MSEKILVPVLGESITEATIAKWLKKEGDSVEADEPIVELETDKVNLEVPSPVTGVLTEIASKDGSVVEVGALLGSVSENGAEASTKDIKKIEPTIKTEILEAKIELENPETLNEEPNIFEENKDEIKKDKLLNLTFSTGWLSLQTQPTFKNNKAFNSIPQNKLNSNVQTTSYYFKHFELIKSILHLSIGGGFKVQRLNLGFNKTLLSTDSISFEKSQEFENNRNVLKYRYWCLPISLSFSNNKKTIVQIEFNNHFLHNGKLDIIYKDQLREITKSRFFQKKYYPSIKLTLIQRNFGLFAESSLISSSTIFENQHNFSCGIIFCNFR